jgi:glyceraldehyde 3-phosphate dehydrogenase
VIVAAPVKEKEALNIVMGVNDALYDPTRHWLLTAASCTTNCLAPVVKVVHETIGIKHGVITTIHDVTNTQVVVDAPHKDLRRARAAGLSLIPTSTGSATAIGLIYPELLGKLTGIAVRVPLLNASMTDCVFEVLRPTTIAEVNGAFKRASESSPLQGILGYETRPLVSIDSKTTRAQPSSTPS